MGISTEQLKQLNHIMKDIPYLIKFQGNNQDFATALLKEGELHMCSAQYYVDQELVSGIRGQGDRNENTIFGFIHVDMECPIYCMYAVYENQCTDNSILIDKRIIQDFCSKGGYVTICETTPFIERFNYEYKDSFDIGLVTYRNRTEKFDMKLLEKNRSSHFFKDADLMYQQEFRIVLDKKLEKIELPEEERILVAKDGEKIWRPYKYDSLNFRIGDITAFSKQLHIKDLKICDGGYRIKL